MAALERGLRQIVNNCITTNKTYDSGRRPETATITSDFTWRYLQVLGWFDSTGFSFARKTIKVANVSSGRFCVIWRSHPNKDISYFTHVCYGNNISIYPVLRFVSGIESFNQYLLLVFLCGLKGSQLCVVYWLGGLRVNDYHQMPFKFQVLESFVRPTFTKDPKSISSTSHIKFCQCCQVHFHKLNGIWFNFVMLCNQLPLSFLEAE